MNNIEDMYALSPLQEGLLFHTVAEPDSSAYHQQMVIELQGNLEPELLQQAWHNTIARHAILRACYVWEQLDAPLQVIQQSIQSPIQWEHWTAESDTNAEAWQTRLEALITSEQQQAFSLLQAPLMRLRVMQVAEQRAFLIWTYHHLIIDGWSSGLLLSEWLHSYQQLQQGVAIDDLQLEKAPNFRRYIAWLQQQDQNQAQAFWQQQLNQWQGVTPLPLAKTNPTAEVSTDHPYGEQSLKLSTQFTNNLNDFSRRHKVTLNTLAQAAWACVLQAHSNSDDVLFGSTTHGRPASLDGADDMVGLFINTLPLRVQVQAQQSLISLLQQLQEQNSDMRQFDYISPAQIRQWCQHQEEQWFQSILVFENFPIDAALDQLAEHQPEASASSEGHGGSGVTKALSARVHHSIERVNDENGIEAFVHRGRNHFPLTLVWIPGEQAEIAISYQLQHYSHQAAQLLLKQYQSVLQHMLADAEQSINQLALQQQDQIDIGLAGDTLAVNDWLDEVRQHIQQQPEHIAVVDAHGALSYGQLDQHSNQLAQVLGLSTDDKNKAEIGSVVAIIADRSNAMMTALLASLKAGFAYVLIDPSLPQARIESLIRDSAARWIVSTADELPSFDHADVTALPQFILARDGRLDAAHNPALVLSELPQHDPNIQVPAETLAYLIYTSGSTGAPKAVMVPRRALANYSAGFLARHGEHLGEQVATMATVAADLGNTQLFATLAAGKTLHLLSYDCIHDPDAVASYMHEHSIDSLKIVPSHLQGLLAAAQAQQVLPHCSLILGGEATSPALLKQLRELAPDLRLINHYGPSETTVGICSHSVESSDSAVDFPLGLPFANTQLLVLDEQLEPVATGQRGELYVRGPTLAHGYLGQARQSALAFIPDPFTDSDTDTGQRLYKTGDAVRQRADGRLEYLGRVDQQVKIRGYRVEPLELEQRLRQLCLESETASAESIISDIAVAAQNATHNTLQGESKQLVAYVMNPQGDSAELQTHLEQLQQRLSQQLPDYLLPSRWMVLEAFPLNANGKLDRRQLPQPSAMETATADQNGAAQKVLPRNPVEAALAAIWQEVLNVDGEMGIHDDFFSLGGDSILNLQIIARANRQGIKLTPKQLFEHKTIAEIAAVANVVNPDLRDDNDANEQTAATNQLPISSAQAHYLQHEQVHRLSRWRWFHCQDMQWTQLQAAWQQLLHNYPVLRSRFIHNEQTGWQCTLSDVEQATQLSRCTRDTEQSLVEQASQWQMEHGLSNVDQALIAACAICSADDDESINALIIRVHPLVMDDSQWDELIDHLHGFYRDPQDQRHVEAVQYQDWLSALPAAALCEKIKASSNTKASQSLSTALFAQAPKADYTELLRKHRLQWSQLLAYALQQALHSDAFQTKSLNTQGFSLQLSQRPQTHFDVPKPEHSEHDAFGNHRYSRVLGCFEQAVVVPHLSIEQSDTDLLQQLRQHKVNLYQQIHSGRWFKQDASVVGLSVSESIATRTEHLQEASPRLSETTVLSDAQQLHVHLQVDNAEANSTQVSLHSQATLEAFDNHQLQQLHQSIEQQLHHILKRLVELTPSPAALVDFPLLALRDTRAMDTTLDEVQLDWANVADLYPLSPMQEGLLLHTLLRPNSGIYLMQQYYHWQGELNEDLLSQAWSVLLQRYPVLRTGFYSQGEGQPIQVVYRQQANPVQFYDWRDKNRSEQESAMEAMLAEERTQGYDMQNGPLTRLRVVRISDDRYDIMRSFHHVLTDAWCFSLLMMDFMAIYEGMLAGREIHLSPPRPYRDYIAWLERQDKASAEQFWRDYLHDFTTPTPLALAAPAHDEGQYGIDNHQLEVLSKAETQQLNALAQSCQVTPNTFLQAAWILLLSYYSGERDIVVGVTTSGRPADMEGVEEIFGLFINSLPLRIEINAQDKLKDWAKVLLDENIKTRQYEYTPLVDIQRLSQVSKGEEIFQSLIVFENAPIDAALDEERDQFNVDRGKDRVHTNYPITVVGYPGDELGVRLSYETQKFSAKAVNQMLQHLMQLLRQMLAQPEATLGELNPLSDKEQQQLQHWAHSEHQFPVAECWQQAFEQQVAQQADAIAVSDGTETLSYAQLNDDANRIAHTLIQQGVNADDTVAIYGPRNASYLRMIAGILKAGAAYVPLDIHHPQQRIEQILQQSGARLALHSQDHELSFDGEWIALSDALTCADTNNPTCRVQANNLAYVIYTSGSTGTPKGVMVQQQGMLNNILGKVPALGITKDDVIAQTASPCFDISVWQFLAAPALGARVEILVDDIAKDPYRLAEAIENRGISLLEVVPALMPGLIDSEHRLESLRWVLPTGEALPNALCQRWFEHFNIPLMNAYGPAECSDDVAFQPLHQAPPPADTSVAIGQATANNRLYVLNQQQQALPVGVVGEIAIAGTGVGRGYVSDARRTALSFVPNPFSDQGERLYLTGDLGRWNEDGILDYVGRLDQQVKIRGHRIELGEVEAVLEQLSGVERAAVITRADSRGDLQLLAFVEAPNLDVEQIKQELSQQLPNYMVPQGMAVLAQLPLNANGKVDRRNLPDIDEPQRQYQAPQGELEQQLAQLWQDLLNCGPVGRDDNFFELGGHSLLATQVLARIRQQLKVELSLRTVFESNTIVQLAQAIAASQQDENAEPSIPTVSRKHPLPLSYAQQRLWFVDQLEGSNASYNMPTAVQLDGELNVAALQQAAQAILQRHESLRTRFGIEGDLPRQFIVEDCELELPLVDISHLSGDEQANKVQQLINEAAAHGFDLSQAPLIRGLLIRCSAQHHILQFTVHHIASDAWSMGVLFSEFMQCYQAMAQDQASPLAPLPLQYADYAHWQRSETQQLRINKAIDYWRRRLHDAPMQLRLPLDHQRPTQADYRGASISHRLSAAQSQQLKDYAQSQQASVFMVLLNIFNAVVQRATGMNDFLIGTDIANREQRDLESLIGFFVNVLPLRAQLNAGDNFDQRLSSLKEHTLDAYQHQQAPFDKLVEVLQPPRQSGVNPLVQALFVMQNTPQSQLDLGALQAQVLNSQHEQSKFDLAVFVEQEDDGALNIRWLYRRSLFEAPTIAQLQQGFESLLDLVAQDSASCLNAWNWTMKTSSNAPSHAATNTASDQPASRKAERKKAKLGKLKRTKAKSVSQAPEQQVKTSILSPHIVDQQRVDQQAEAASQDASSSALPLIIEPKLSELNPIAWAEQARGWVEQQLERHGGLLFRGFSLANAEQFEHFAQALEPTLYGRYGDLPKNNSGKNIYHSTPYPEQQMILYHNESSHMAKWPRKQWFYCEIAPQDRGCTPIVDCRQVYRQLPAAVIAELESKGLLYVRHFTDQLDVRWEDFFKTDDPNEVEAQCRAADMGWTWSEGNNGRKNLRIEQFCPAVIQHPITGEKSFFNQVQLHHECCLDPEVRRDLRSQFGADQMPRNVYYGDGSVIADETMEIIGRTYEQCAVRFQWQQGDVVMLDNMLVAHARDPFSGPRKICVAMGQMITRAALAEANAQNQASASHKAPAEPNKQKQPA